jgi:1,2-diacylglycerol 3-beta-galactosyltransferase
LNHSGQPVQLALLSGGNDRLYRQFQDIEWHARAHFYGFVDDMPSMMHASDFVMSKAGGLIVSETLACGLPMLLIDVLPGQETGNAEYVVEHGAGELVEGPLSVLESAYHWLENDGALLEERTQNARRIGRPQAADEIAEKIWKAERVTTTQLDRSRLEQLLDRYNVPWRR